MYKLVNEILEKIKQQRPLILNLTNYVSIDFVANGLLSVGASPIMSFAAEEVKDLTKLSKALVINFGTLNPELIHICEKACSFANELNIPIIFDPVGAGASEYRTKTYNNFLNRYRFSIIRANAGEVMSLTGSNDQTKGVDSITNEKNTNLYAEKLSTQFKMTVCMSGECDWIVDQIEKIKLQRGSALMPLITGTGCLLSAIVGAFHAVHPNRFEAAAAASLFYSICGEIAEKKSNGPASFKVNFIDALNTIPDESHYA